MVHFQKVTPEEEERVKFGQTREVLSENSASKKDLQDDFHTLQRQMFHIIVNTMQRI